MLFLEFHHLSANIPTTHTCSDSSKLFCFDCRKKICEQCMSVTTDSLLCHGCGPAARKVASNGPAEKSSNREDRQQAPTKENERNRQKMQRGFVIRSDNPPARPFGGNAAASAAAGSAALSGLSASRQDIVKLELASIAFSLVIAKFWSLLGLCFG